MVSAPLISLSEAKSACGLDPVNTAQDEEIAFLSAVATEQIEAATRRLFTAQTHRERFSTRRRGAMHYDIGGYSSDGLTFRARHQHYSLKGIDIQPETLVVRYDPLHLFGENTTITEGIGWSLLPTGALLLAAATEATPAGLRVEYTAGWAVSEGDGTLSTSAPADLRLACRLQVAFLRVRSRSDNVGMRSERGVSIGKENGGGSSAMFASSGGIAPEALSLLSKYRHLSAGRG
jgi:hypothetical protein